MKKTLIRAMMIICTLLLIFATAVSGKQTLAFKADATATFTDGGYYAKGSGFGIAAGDGGLKLTSEAKDRCLWAFTNETVDAYPYLTYELPEGGAIFKMTVSKNWDVEQEIELDIKPGKHTVNLKEVLSVHKTTSGYSYVVVYLEGEAVITGFALADTGSEPVVPADPTTPDTADLASIAVFAAVISCTTIAFAKKKHRSAH